MEKKKKKLHIVQVIFFLLLLGVGSGALLFGVCEGKTTSELEKRELAEFPSVSAEDIFSGKFESDFSEALSDHIIGRDMFVTAKTWVQIALGKREIDGIFVDGDRLIETYKDSDFDEKQIQNNIANVTEFMATSAGGIGADHVKMMLVPSKCSLYRDELPAYLSTSKRADTLAQEIRNSLSKKQIYRQPDQETEDEEDDSDDAIENDKDSDESDEDSDESIFDDEDSDESIFGDDEEDMEETDDSDDTDDTEDEDTDKNDSVNSSDFISPETAEKMVIDLRPVLNEHKSEDIYYLTDHHWTTLGAGYAYQSLFPTAGNVVDGDTETISEDFLGTDYNRIHYYKSKDTIRRYIIPEAGNAGIEINDSGDKSHRDSIYDNSALQTSDKYNYFLSGNYSAIEVDTDAKSDKTLLIVKDSFSNSLIPFLCKDYKKIIMIDLRYVNSSIYDNIPDNTKPDDVLIVYNEEKFMQDTHQIYLE